jgi:hypothetical protein
VRAFQTIAWTTIVFLLVGPALGALVVLGTRGALGVGELAVAYAFGSIPALIAGAAFGVVRDRARDSPFRWHVRALWGACAGLMGSLAYWFGDSLAPLFARPPASPVFEWAFLQLIVRAAVPAGIVCALFVGLGKRQLGSLS